LNASHENDYDHDYDGGYDHADAYDFGIHAYDHYGCGRENDCDYVHYDHDGGVYDHGNHAYVRILL